MSKAFLLDQQSYTLADLRKLRSSHDTQTINISIHIKIDMNYLIPSFSSDSGRFKQLNFTLLSFLFSSSLETGVVMGTGFFVTMLVT